MASEYRVALRSWPASVAALTLKVSHRCRECSNQGLMLHRLGSSESSREQIAACINGCSDCQTVNTLCREETSTIPGSSAAQAKQFREQQRLGLLSQEDFVLDTSALSKRKADLAGAAAWPEEHEGPSDDDFDADAPSQVAAHAGCSIQRLSLLL